MITCCPKCGVAEYETETDVCAYCEATAADREQAQADVEAAEAAKRPPSVLWDMNADEAKAYVAAQTSVDELQALLTEEMQHPKFGGGRAGVIRTIETAITARSATA